MNCLSCKVDVPSIFYAAISANKCPACGQKIMSQSEYGDIANIKQALKRLEFNDEQLTKIAAALISKYDFNLKNPDSRKVTEPKSTLKTAITQDAKVVDLPPLGEKAFYASDDPLNDSLPGEGGSADGVNDEDVGDGDNKSNVFNLSDDKKAELREMHPRKEVVDFMSKFTAGALPPTLPKEDINPASPEVFDRMERAKSLQDNLDSKYRFTRR